MIEGVKMKRAMLGLMLMLAAGSATTALADDTPVDARLQGYPGNVAPTTSAPTTQWLELVVLGAAGVGVLFINARRSHLD